MNDIFGVSNSVFDEHVITTRRSYTAHYMMDLVELIIEARTGKSCLDIEFGFEKPCPVQVTKLCGRFVSGETSCVFLCILISDFFLVLQFNKPL